MVGSLFSVPNLRLSTIFPLPAAAYSATTAVPSGDLNTQLCRRRQIERNNQRVFVLKGK